MTIPERFFRIARHKFTELKDRLEQLDEEREQEAERRLKQKLERTEARRELEEAVTAPLPPVVSKPASASAPPARSAVPAQPPLPRRTPEEIAAGVHPTVLPVPADASLSPTAPPSAATQPDPLEYHYKLLGVEPGADFAAVQNAYHRLAARCDPSRFPADSNDAQEAHSIRKRLDASYSVLRDALDTTARRFHMLDFDAPNPPQP